MFAYTQEGYLRNGWLPGYNKSQTISTYDSYLLALDGSVIVRQNSTSVYGFSRWPSLITTLASSTRSRREAALVGYGSFA